MAIAYRATGTLAMRGSATTATLTPALPAGTATGDVMLLVATSFQSTGSVAINTPAGWTLLATSASYDGGLWRSATYLRVAGASETAPGLTTAAACWLDAQILGFTGVDTTTPVDAGGSAYLAAATGATVTVPSITTVTANAWWVFATSASNTLLNSSSVPSGWTQRTLANGNTGNSVVDTVLVAAAGATTATSYPRPGSAGFYVSLPLALRPSGGAAPTFVPQIAIT
jgi:hypothetical protein